MATLTNAPVQGRILKIYDHLYANAPMKTPAAISYEFGKVAHTCLYMEKYFPRDGSVLFVNRKGRKKRDEPDLLDRGVAQQIRDTFLVMCELWSLYANDREIKISDFDIEYCINQLSGLQFSDKNSDLMGDIFEIMRSKFAKEKGGQFFTDPQVTHLAIKMLRFEPRNGDDLVDICAGTGGFLLAGMAHLDENLDDPKQLQTSNLRDAFIGVEIDKDAADAANGTIQARFGAGVSGVVSTRDALTLFDHDSYDPRIREGGHRCVATNPPFGTKITIKDPRILEKFELSRLSSKDGLLHNKIFPQSPDTLFLEQNIRLLKPGVGRLAIVVPYQMLSGPHALGLRQWLLHNAQVHGVVDLPADTFQPHTGTKGALLLVSKRLKYISDLSEVSSEQVFMSAPRYVGHDRRGNAVYRKGDDPLSASEILTDFPDVGQAFDEFLAGSDPGSKHDQSFTVSLHDILASKLTNLNANFYLNRPQQGIADSDAIEQFVPLSELVEKVFFPTRFKRNFVNRESPGAVPFMGGAGITEFISTGKKWIGSDDPHLERLRVSPGWILVTRSGSTGIVSTVPADWDGYALSEHVIRVVPNSKKMSPGYIYSILSSSYGQDYLRRGVFGSVIDEITPDYIAAMPIPILKNRDKMNQIGEVMDRAEDSRSSAMKAFSSSIAEINNIMG